MVDGYMHFSLCLEYIIDVTFVAAKLQKKGVLALGIYFFLSELGGFLSASLLGGCVRIYFFLSYIPQSLAQTAGPPARRAYASESGSHHGRPQSEFRLCLSLANKENLRKGEHLWLL
jgi:hypothetical protein